MLLVEWGDAVQDLLPEDRLRVQLTTDRADAETRRIVVAAQGRSWVARWGQLEAALGPFRGIDGDVPAGGAAR